MDIRPLTGKTILSANGVVLGNALGARGSPGTGFRSSWNGNMYVPPPLSGCVLYYPGRPGTGTVIEDYSNNFSDSGIDTDEALDATETGVDCDADATTAIPVGSFVIIDSEKMKVTATGTTLTVIRGYASVSATHDTNADIRVWIPNNGAITGATWEVLSSGLPILRYDGDNDYIDGGTNSLLNFTTGAFTISIWVKPANLAQYAFLFCRGLDKVDGYYLAQNSAGLVFATSQALVAQVTSAVNCVSTSWQNIMVVRDGASVRLLVNGVDVVSSAGTHINPTTSARSLKIGVYDNLAYDYTGLGATVTVFNGALAVAERPLIFNSERYLFGV